MSQLARARKHTSLAEPEAVKLFIVELKTSNSYKRNLCIAYNNYCKFYNITWNMPSYPPEARNIALPTKEKIEMLIAAAGYILSTKLELSMKTGLRPVELSRLRVKDIDVDHNTINPTTAKKRQCKNNSDTSKPHAKTSRTHCTGESNCKRARCANNNANARPRPKYSQQNRQGTLKEFPDSRKTLKEFRDAIDKVL